MFLMEKTLRNCGDIVQIDVLIKTGVNQKYDSMIGTIVGHRIKLGPWIWDYEIMLGDFSMSLFDECDVRDFV